LVPVAASRNTSSTLPWPLLSAGLILFGMPVFLFFFLAFGLFPVLYLDHLALVGRVVGHKDLDLQHIAEKELRDER
jgi:hypothetical protein